MSLLSNPQPLAALPKKDVPMMSQEDPLSHPQPLAALPKKEDVPMMSQEDPLSHPQPLAALPKKEDAPIMAQEEPLSNPQPLDAIPKNEGVSIMAAEEPLSNPQPLAALPKKEDAPIMAQEKAVSNPQPPLAALPKKEDGIQAGQEMTSDYYRVDPNLPSRFNHPEWFRGYRMKERNPLFRTTNMDYGGKPPTVHEMPTSFHVSPHTFTDTRLKFGKYINHGMNTALEKSYVTGPDNRITAFDTFDFHPSYRTGGPSFCE
ncbi:UPF0691 protein C9orf116 homolog [Sceloporus undulatus]|uniref:UPF0691 protein C9orf116 homolog n=1 Tax=Sceloporus undulatus TaxID=8520 RepID=UPI001C4D661E|nr:UPF0691 protein C9orf116 homolog [Sceloporus undulatus]